MVFCGGKEAYFYAGEMYLERLDGRGRKESPKAWKNGACQRWLEPTLTLPGPSWLEPTLGTLKPTHLFCLGLV